MANSEQFNKGQDIILSIYPDDVIDFDKVGDNTAGLSVLLYPTGLDVTIDSNRSKIKVASIGYGYNAETSTTDGEITLPADNNVEYATCTFSYRESSEMDEGHYSIEVVYVLSDGSDNVTSRVVMKNDNAFTLVESAAHYKGVKNVIEG